MKQPALEKLLRFTKQFIRLRTLGHLWNALIKLHEADVASLIENLSLQERRVILKLFMDRKMEAEQLAAIFSEIRPEIAVELLSELQTPQIAPILEEMSSDDAASLISLFAEDLQDALLKRMKKEDAVDVQEQLAYPEESAGRVMSADFLALEEKTTAGDAITAIQLAQDEVEVPFYLYVIDDEHHLKGVVSLKQIILVNPKTPLGEIMITDVYKVDAYTDQEEVAAVVANYNLLAVPVVDERNCLLGVVTVDDIIDIIQEEATEDIYKLAGVTQDYSIDLGVAKSLGKRLPWLLTSLLTTSLSALVVSLFQGTIRQFVILAVLMPMVAALGGVVGNQTVAIMVREIVLGNLDWKRSRKILFKELLVSIGSGVIIGLLASAAAIVLFQQWIFGAIFGTAILFNLIIATLLGTLIPLTLRTLRLDPALASGMMVTMLTDVFGYFCFLGLAAIILF